MADETPLLLIARELGEMRATLDSVKEGIAEVRSGQGVVHRDMGLLSAQVYQLAATSFKPEEYIDIKEEMRRRGRKRVSRLGIRHALTRGMLTIFGGIGGATSTAIIKNHFHHFP